MLNKVINTVGTALDSFEKSTEYPYPIFRVEVDGIDISPMVASRLMSLNIKDNRGLVVDSVDLELDDSDGQLAIPPKGAVIQVWLGWSNTGLIDKGKYKVDSTSHRGAPDVLSISAMANDVSEGLRQKRERSWSKNNIKEIFEKVGAEYDLKVIVHEKFATKSISYIAQNESDANLITRIADEQDAIATIKNGHLILLPRGASQTVSGLALPMAIITRAQGDQHSYTNGTGTDNVTGVKAFYYDGNKSKKLYVTVGDSEDNPKEIRYVHRDKTTAELAANAEYNRCKRSAQKLTYSIAKGDPTLLPEQEFTFSGLKPEIDDIIWLGTNITHSLGDSGLPKYKHYGELLIAETAEEAGLLIYNHYESRRHSFYYNHKFRLYWWELDYDKYNKAVQHLEDRNNEAAENGGKILTDKEIRESALKNCSAAKEICNAQVEPLYFQRNEITDESWYYFKLQSPWSETKTTFTADQMSSRSKFKPRVMSVMSGAMWTGTDQQLETFIKRTTERLREVKTIDYIGYSREYETYIFEKHAVHKGQVIPINEHDFFKIKRKEIKTLASSPAITINPKKEFNPTWWNDFYRVRGAKGIIALAWWMGSYFAEQIRAEHSSYPFMEIVGEAGAGKSRLIEMMWKLSGRKDYEGFDANKSTNVAVYRNFAQIANLPVVLIEGDRNDVNGNAVQKSKFSWDELKDAFNGRAIRSKGLKTAGNETYEPPFRGSILISQNTAIQASEAILTRTLHLYFDRKGQSLETKRIVDELDRMELEDACTFMTHCLRNESKILETYKNSLQEIEAEYHEMGITHTRIALCHAQVASLITAMAQHVLPIDLEEVVEAQDMLQVMARDRVDQLNGDHPDVEKFWDVYEYLEGNRSAAWSLNHHDSDNQTVAINLNEVYKVAARNFQQLPEINEMKKLLRTSRKYKFIESNRQCHSERFPADEVSGVAKDREPTVKPKRNVKCWIFTNPNLWGK